MGKENKIYKILIMHDLHDFESDIEVKKKIPIFDFHYIQNASHVLETIRIN